MALGESSDKIIYLFDPFPYEESREDWGNYASIVSDYCIAWYGRGCNE